MIGPFNVPRLDRPGAQMLECAMGLDLDTMRMATQHSNVVDQGLARAFRGIGPAEWLPLAQAGLVRFRNDTPIGVYVTVLGRNALALWNGLPGAELLGYRVKLPDQQRPAPEHETGVCLRLCGDALLVVEHDEPPLRVAVLPCEYLERA